MYYDVVSIGVLGVAKPERSFDRRTDALRYRDQLNAKWREQRLEQMALVVHPEVEEYVEWQDDDDE